jgi:hypothetical protein
MVVYRHATFGSPLRTEPARQPGRYHIAGDASPTQYLCIHPMGPLAEFMRFHSTRLPEHVSQIRARTWALRLELESLLRITFDNAVEFGLSPEDLVSDDHSKCREVASELRGSDIPGILVPSAALPGTSNVVIFGPRVGGPYLLDAIGEVDIPASITAEAGRPVRALLERVRFVGQSHRELEAWQHREPFEFAEPDWEVLASPDASTVTR